MMLPSVPPLLAADPGTIIGLIVGALTLLGWILNYANQKQAQQPPVHRPQRPRPQRPGDDRLQSEIDVFLEEVRGGRRKLGEEPARPAAEARPAQRPERRAPRPVEQRQLEPKVAPRVEPKVTKRKRPAAAEDRPRVRPRVTEHVSTDRIEAHASQLGRGVEAAVQSHLGLFTATDAPAPAPASAAGSAAPASTSLAQRVRTMLREPEGVRQAVLISEILRVRGPDGERDRSSRTMNVLLFAGRFEVRGSSKYTLRLAQHLGEHGIRAVTVCSDAAQVDAGARAGITLCEYPHLDLPLWGRVVMDLVRRDFDDRPPDLIHIQTRQVLAQGLWLARRLERPAVLTVYDYLGPRERLRVDRQCVRRIVAVSEAVKADLIHREAFPDEFVTVIHSGVDVPEVVDAPPVLDPGHLPVVGTAGPLEAVKGLPFFLGAAARVLVVRPNTEFLIAGAGPEERSLRRLARELGIAGRVTFIPRLYDFSQSLEAMDVYCLPSLQQGLGTIMLEAMARSRPVIAAGVGGVSSAVRDGETGLVVPPSDSSRLAERILELLEDPVRARALGEAGRRLVRDEFGVEKMIQRMADLYGSVSASA